MCVKRDIGLGVSPLCETAHTHIYLVRESKKEQTVPDGTVFVKASEYE